jgi:tetratricopeptide (TPR) repeat protein
VIAALLSLSLALAAGAAEPAPPARFEAANRAYLAGELEEAAHGYQELLADGWESPALHVNLGNARYRLGQRGFAVASYARALKLDPGDGDARANLDLVRRENVDQVLGAEARPLLLRAVDRVPDGWALGLFGLCWVALWAGLAGRRFAARGGRRELGALAFGAALLAVAAGGLLAGKAASRSVPTAVVVAPVAEVREGPERALAPSFELHEGTEVRVLEVRRGAVLIRLGNGLEGWIGAAEIEPI